VILKANATNYSAQCSIAKPLFHYQFTSLI